MRGKVMKLGSQRTCLNAICSQHEDAHDDGDMQNDRKHNANT